MPELDTLPALLAQRARHDGERRAVVTAEAAVTYAELDAASAACAAGLVAGGVVKGDRVGLLAPNGIEWVVHAMAVLRIGAVLVPLSTLLRPPELLAQLQLAAVSHLVLAEGFKGRRYLDDLAAAEIAPHSVATPSLRAVWPLHHRTDPNDANPDDANPDDANLGAFGGLQPAEGPQVREGAGIAEVVAAMEQRVRAADDLVVLFTSGSRGAPKGVVHTHGGALRATAAGLEARCIGPGERLYLPMPFFWTGGFGGGLLSALVAGATLLTEADPEPTRTLALLERERVTLFRGWPDQAARLAAHPDFASADLSSLGDGSLGAVLPPERRPAPGARANLFGMTESFGPYCGDRLDLDLPDGKHGSCGRPFAGVEVRIADPDSGEERPAGAEGEIWLRGPNLLRGICGRLREDVFTPAGWYRTGDLGRLDADGYLWNCGRLDDMVKVKGATVYPSEVEDALRQVSGVRQAYVTDVPSAADTREVAALVVTDAALADVIAGVRVRLSAFKVPTRWLLTSDPSTVPMLATGKVDKAGLQQLLAAEGG